MVSALWALQGAPERSGLLAAASRRERFRVCNCRISSCLSEKLAEQWMVELVPGSSRSDQQARFNEALEIVMRILLRERRWIEFALLGQRCGSQKRNFLL